MLYIYIINHLNKPWHHQAQRFLRPPKILLLALGHGGQHQAVLDHLQGLSSFEKDKTMEKPRKNHGKSMFLGFFEFFGVVNMKIELWRNHDHPVFCGGPIEVGPSILGTPRKFYIILQQGIDSAKIMEHRHEYHMT